MLKRLISMLLVIVLALSVCGAALADDVMRPGDEGDHVKELQTLLKNYGYYTGAIDGKYGNGTYSAVKSFQKHNDLTKDGKAGPLTMEKLKGSDVVSAPVTDESVALAENKHIQERLTHYGFYTGKIDGVIGKGSKAAIKAFQEANGLEKDGVVGAQTLAALNSDTAVSQKDVEDEIQSWLKKGSEGDDVKTLQQHLADTLYYTGDIDGVFGDAVHAAVVEFQKAAGIQADGIVGESTRNALYSRSAAIFNGGTPVRTMHSGSKGYDVKLLQQRLAALNYFNAPVSGYFCAKTLEAVKAFQKDNGMLTDGTVDAIVRRHLWPTTAENEPDKYPKLEKNDSGTYVTQAQMRLKAAGFLNDTADGIFGDATLRAVKNFQKSNKLTVDGKIGEDTWALLMLVDLNGAEPDATRPSNAVLRPGAAGLKVKELQEYLVELGYDITVDGKYGPKTTEAVKAFQAANDLTKDGKAGPLTMEVIYTLLSK